MLVGLLIVSGYTSINAVVKAELFPARIRALGVGLPYALTVAIFGGTTEYVALGLKNIGHENWFFFYVAVPRRTFDDPDRSHTAELGRRRCLPSAARLTAPRSFPPWDICRRSP